MSVADPHPLYSGAIDRWTRCRLAYEGEDAVKDAAERFLPKIDPGQTGAEYAAYLARAMYYEAVGRTVDGFVGAIIRKPPTVTWPKPMDVFLADVDAQGVGLIEFIKRLCRENLLVARAGMLVDFDEAAGRAYISVYEAENIVNWGSPGVVLHETVFETDPADEFKQKPVEQYRQLLIVDGNYEVRIWRRAQDSAVTDPWRIVDVIQPTRRGERLDQVPFFWVSPLGQSPAIERPPLLGLVNVALSHYRSSADLEHGRHFTGLPTLYVTGITRDIPIRVGAASAILLSDPQAKVGYAEFTGQGLASLENALAVKEQQMASLGAALLGGPRKGVEAAETARIRTSGENSLLMGVVSAVEECLEAALCFAAKWMGVEGDIDVDINRDFIDLRLDRGVLTELVNAYQKGTITIETFLFNLQQAEMLRPDVTVEDEAAALGAGRKPPPETTE